MKKWMILLVAAALSACSVSHYSSGVYTPRQTMNEQSVRMGYVESIREIVIEKGQSGVGTLTGAALGGLAGSNVGQGKGSVAAGILGAVAGGMIGQSIEKDMNHVRGLEITIKLDSGELRAITQDADEMFRIGDRVRLLSNGHTTRVTH